MLARVVLLALSVLAMVAGTQAQCPSGTTIETCTSTEMTTASTTDGTAVLALLFRYCAPNPVAPATLGYGTGTIAQLISGTLTITSPSGGVTGFGVSALTGSVTTGAPGSVVTTAILSGQAPILTFGDNMTPGAGVLAQITINGETVSITSNAPNVATEGIQLPLSTATLPATLRDFDIVSQDTCNPSVLGDPLFSGFMGQQFYVGGEDGQVMNLLSTFNMQLNGRFLNMNEGDAIMPAEQEKLRLLSLVRHQEEPAVPAFPKTTPWSHPGNYFGEAGVALLDNSRLYAKAGSYQTGFAKVTLNGRPMPVSDESIVLGAGSNTTFIQRISAHEVMVRTVNVEFTLTNSDNFLNVDRIHLERGFKQYSRFSGLLGMTVDSKWSWNKADEEAAVVESNDLFELTALEA